MWNTIKDYAAAIFYVIGAIVVICLIAMMSAVLLIPVLIYGTYQVIQISRQLREQKNAEIKYTTPHRDRTKSYEDR